MDPLTTGSLISGGLGLVGSLFGSKKKTSNPYAPKANAAYRSLQGTVRPQYQQLQQRGTANYNRYAPQSQAATGSLIAMLKQNPYTDAYSTNILQRTDAQNLQDKIAAQSRLAQRLSQSGNDGLMAGGMANLESDYLQNLTQSRNDLAYRKVDAQQNQALALQQLLQGLTNDAQGQETAALGQLQGIDSNLLSLFLGAGQNQSARNDAYNANQAANQGQMAGSVGSLVAALLAKKKKGLGGMDNSTVPRFGTISLDGLLGG